MDKSISVHHRNIQYLAIEMFKVKLGIAPLFVADIFEKRLIPNEGIVSGLRSPSYFYNYNNPRTVFYGEHCGIWKPKFGLFYRLKSKHPTTFMFKANIKTWVLTNCVYLMNQVWVLPSFFCLLFSIVLFVFVFIFVNK